ncbi:glycoside hydrolase family 47 protein [Sphingomonas nostoxanthinifaciens]|uniref:glycoside hydrolase family 47 protein n=1 Tax=Sphingomonas nostoxanthinifaciens TaxID=2872652 RepID=UPI001CC219B9|nr:glycoside hydrolase family 47 protein [Sphingomonas nostoxanthinifaciens]UAK26397.1 glycoside hydrolase family 47 protein [Sphingomonas nostoxanthinifaciens]
MIASTRRSFLAAATLSAAPLPALAADRTDWHALGEDVKSEMAWAWDHYRTKAWGRDEIKPISGTFSSFVLPDRHLGLSLIEAMDTLWVMGLDDRFNDALHWVMSELSFDIDGEVQVFEIAIRIVGGLLSAHHAGGEPKLLALARDLTDRLMPAFATKTGLPYRYVNLRSGKVRDPQTNPAEIGTYLPEFGTLSKLTGDRRYYDAAKRAQVALFERRSKIGLLADTIDAETGQWLSRRATVGPPSDSYYEYLWDGWQLFGDRDCKRMYDVCTAAILRHQQDRRDGRLWFADVDFKTGAILNRNQIELASFYGGLLAQGGAHATGVACTMAWSWLQDRYGVLPEGFDYGTDQVTHASNKLRPELADGAFNLWLLDHDPRWRAIGRTHYLAMKRWNRAAYGYADLADVTSDPKRQSDHCPGYWWSEQMKYYYLLFADTPRFDYRRNYLSTEGNVLLGFRRP